MATNLFDKIRVNASTVTASYQWYKQQITKFFGGGSSAAMANKLMKESSLTKRIVPGEMYLFMYDPKHKDTLPYYDAMPLVLPFRQVEDGFYGINLHYLPYAVRFKMLGQLQEYATSNNSDEMKLQLSWRLLNSVARFRPAADFAVKRYLTAHVRSSFYKIDFKDWITASQLPVEKFVGASKTKVWQDFTGNSRGF